MPEIPIWRTDTWHQVARFRPKKSVHLVCDLPTHRVNFCDPNPGSKVLTMGKIKYQNEPANPM